jgi:hypothetical protein
MQFLDHETAASRSFSALFDKVACPQASLARDVDRAMRELALFCDEAFPPHDTHELRAEMRDLVASIQRRDFVSSPRLAQFAQLRALVERLWTARPGSTERFAALTTPTPLLKHEYTRVLLRFDLALVRLKVQVLMKQIQD